MPVKKPILFLCAMFIIAGGAFSSAAETVSLTVKGLHEPVEIITDVWGVAHIYACNEHDLFFAQGYNAARDRLFQFEIWRRQATGTVAEILGPREVKRDIGTRLFMFRGDMQQEMNHYHPRGELIITAYTNGVNAYIDETRKNPDLLPVEFELLNITPGKWIPAVVISRHQGLLMNITQELNYGRAVHLLGAKKVLELTDFQPGEPDIDLDDAIDGSLLFDDILDLYNAFRNPVRFVPDDITAPYRAETGNTSGASLNTTDDSFTDSIHDYLDKGSNNWVVSGSMTQSRYPMMANDPHRTLAVPSLRYCVHLIAPGWNVIGGGEPEIPGVSIGHNEYGAWGLTVFQTDSEDLYVYDTNPDNVNEYKYRGLWEPMIVIRDTITVKGQPPVIADLKYTRHGPVVYEDEKNNKAYAVRAGWREIGGSPYLASLRMNQAHDWESFRDACSYSHIPGENMVWADRNGFIGWQAVGIAPIRPNWSGLIPVPGDGRYEWQGYLPIKAKPHVFDPEQGFWVTANNNLIPRDYQYRDAVGWVWSDPYRANRIAEVLASGRQHSMADMIRLQNDYLSIPARQLVPLLRNISSDNRLTEKARTLLLDWDYIIDKDSAAAGIYYAWERRLLDNIQTLFVPPEARKVIRNIPMTRMIDWLMAPGGEFGENPVKGRDTFLIGSLDEARDELAKRLGKDITGWKLGQLEYKHVLIRHPLSGAVNEEMQRKLNAGPLPRGGGRYTVGYTGGGNIQTSGASFKIIIDTGNWDNSVWMNTPGQSGNPENSHYRDLFELWADDSYIPAVYSRDKVESVAEETIMLEP